MVSVHSPGCGTPRVPEAEAVGQALRVSVSVLLCARACACASLCVCVNGTVSATTTLYKGKFWTEFGILFLLFKCYNLGRK